MSTLASPRSRLLPTPLRLLLQTDRNLTICRAERHRNICSTRWHGTKSPGWKRTLLSLFCHCTTSRARVNALLELPNQDHRFSSALHFVGSLPPPVCFITQQTVSPWWWWVLEEWESFWLRTNFHTNYSYYRLPKKPPLNHWLRQCLSCTLSSSPSLFNPLECRRNKTLKV